MPARSRRHLFILGPSMLVLVAVSFAATGCAKNDERAVATGTTADVRPRGGDTDAPGTDGALDPGTVPDGTNPDVIAPTEPPPTVPTTPTVTMTFPVATVTTTEPPSSIDTISPTTHTLPDQWTPAPTVALTIPPLAVGEKDCGISYLSTGWPTTPPPWQPFYDCLKAAWAAGQPTRGIERIQTDDHGSAILVTIYDILGPGSVHVIVDATNAADRPQGITRTTCTAMVVGYGTIETSGCVPA